MSSRARIWAARVAIAMYLAAALLMVGRGLSGRHLHGHHDRRLRPRQPAPGDPQRQRERRRRHDHVRHRGPTPVILLATQLPDITGLAFAGALSKADQGKFTAVNWVWALILSVGAWFLRMPVSEAAAQPDASVWWIGVEACLVLVFLWGVEGLVVAMLPMRFLDGRKVIDWNRVVWSILMFLGVFAPVHVLMSPSSGSSATRRAR